MSATGRRTASRVGSSSSASLAGRAVAALLLTVSFYGLALLIAAALIAIPVLEVGYANRLHIKLALVCGVGAFAILAAIRPRFDRFVVPGVRLDLSKEPRLLPAIEQVAKRAGQPVPAEVYLVPDFNAFVTERGGLMGIGSRRVMGIGLPVLQSLTISQFLGVLAHEFGHFHGGDTKLGPWIYKTQQALMRTVANLQESALQLPFIGYAKLFLRITGAISRSQEYQADAFAVEIVGKQAFAEGLRKVHAAEPVYRAYWQNELVPVLASGYRPDISSGFARFVATPEIEQALEKILADQEHNSKTEVYDTHPALSDRLAAIALLPDKQVQQWPQSALQLLERPAEHETRLLTFQFGKETIAELKPVDWRDVGRDVYLPRWRKMVEECAEVFRTTSVETLPKLLEPYHNLRTMVAAKGESPETCQAKVIGAVGAGLACALAERGWQVLAMPGGDIEMIRDGVTLLPFKNVQRWHEEPNTAVEWPARCQQLKLAGPVVTAG